MLKAPVFQPVCSPPRPACLTTNELTFMFAPRSTWRNLVPAAVEHHLLLTPSSPSTASPGPSLAAHAAEPVAGLPRARLVPRLGAAGGGVKPSLKDGGTFAAAVPHALGLEPIVNPSVAPPAISA